jgi:flavin reductase (DIM6/NTAB) family NADH-FMN oxidoreductase RutF
MYDIRSALLRSMTTPPAMRRTMGRFLTGVTIVTAADDGAVHGMTVNSLTSVSLDPPLLLVCLTNAARTTTAVLRSRRFVVNILSARQERIALRFARRGADHFADLPLVPSRYGSPVVPDALAHLDCAVQQVMSAGDHQVVIATVHRLDDREGEPLGFFGGRFCTVAEESELVPQWFY